MLVAGEQSSNRLLARIPVPHRDPDTVFPNSLPLRGACVPLKGINQGSLTMRQQAIYVPADKQVFPAFRQFYSLAIIGQRLDNCKCRYASACQFVAPHFAALRLLWQAVSMVWDLRAAYVRSGLINRRPE